MGVKKPEESKPPIDWPVSPHVGEHIYPNDRQEYEVKKVVHVLHRVAGEAQMQLHVEKTGN